MWRQVAAAGAVGGDRRQHSPMNGSPKVFNIESDPHGEHNLGEMYNWVFEPLLKAVEEYKASLAKNPNPPAANKRLFRFQRAQVRS
jgi:arylsulfatase